MPMLPPADGTLNNLNYHVLSERDKTTFKTDINILYVQSWQLWHHASLGKCLHSLGYVNAPPASGGLNLSLLGRWAMVLSGVFTQLTPASQTTPYMQGGGAVSMDTKEMKRALTLMRRPVSSYPLTPPHVSMPDPFHWATSLAGHTCVSVESGEHYRLQSAVESDQWPTIGPPPLP